jgi:hypothetical protein
VTLTWGKDQIRDTWLRVRVKANERTGLGEDDVFYLGSQVGDATGDRRVNATDISGAWLNLRGLWNPAPVGFLYDFNKDRRVNATDISALWSNLSGIDGALKLFEPAAEQTDGGTSSSGASSLSAETAWDSASSDEAPKTAEGSTVDAMAAASGRLRAGAGLWSREAFGGTDQRSTSEGGEDADRPVSVAERIWAGWNEAG